MLQFKFPKVKLDQEATIREKAIFVLVLIGVFFLFSNSIWSGILDRVRSLRVEARSGEMQMDAVKRLMAAAQTQIAKKKVLAPANVFVDPKIAKILLRRTYDPADEINSTVDLLHKRGIIGRAKVKNVAVGEKIDRPGYSAVPLEVQITGTYSDVQGYMRAIENLSRPVLVNGFSVQRDKENQGSLVAKLDVMLYIVDSEKAEHPKGF